MISIPTTGGTGGGLPYISEEPSPDMANQASRYSCVIACVLQLLRDFGIETTEASLIGEIGLIDGFGSTAESAAKALSNRHGRLKYVGGPLNDEQLSLFFRRDPWIAFLQTERGSFHSVIVDGCAGETVSVRDPWGLDGPGTGTGSRATLSLSDFCEHWRWAICNGIAPDAIK